MHVQKSIIAVLCCVSELAVFRHMQQEKKHIEMAAKKYANKVGMMHESKGQRIGNAPSLPLFHTSSNKVCFVSKVLVYKEFIQ